MERESQIDTNKKVMRGRETRDRQVEERERQMATKEQNE